MRKLVLATCLVAALAAGIAPAVALAGGGGSAGDNQYVDPLSGQRTTHHSTSHPTATTTTTPVAPTPTPTTTTPAVTPAPTSTTAPAPPATTTTTSTSSLARDPSSKHKRLPFTGLNVSVSAVVGAVLVATGMVVRRTLAPA